MFLCALNPNYVALFAAMCTLPLVGIESPMPLPIKVIRPKAEPESKNPQYKKHWV